MRHETYDLAVIGSGGAAMAAGIQARSHGKAVILVERGVVGGRCLVIGCVPSQTLPAASGQREHALHSPFGGAPTSAGPVDLTSLVEQERGLVDGPRDAKYLDVADAHGLPILRGEATSTDQGTVLVDGQPLPSTAYVVATGSEPAAPDLPGLDGVPWLTSTPRSTGQER